MFFRIKYIKQFFINVLFRSVFFLIVVAQIVFFLAAFFRSARTSWNTLVRPSVRKKNLDQLYGSINHHRTTASANLKETLSGAFLVVSGEVWSISGGVWGFLMHVWWCQ